VAFEHGAGCHRILAAALAGDARADATDIKAGFLGSGLGQSSGRERDERGFDRLLTRAAQ